jgi:DNA-binding transcriptional regulator YiaG
MKDSPLKVTLDEITPEKILEIEEYLLNERLADLTRNNLIELGNYRRMIKAHSENVEGSCKLRAIRASNVGLSIKEIADTLGYSTTTIKKWVTVY